MMHTKKPLRVVFTALAVLVAVRPARAQGGGATLDGDARREIVEALSRELNRAYVFPEKAVAMERELRARIGSGTYDAISDPGAFARRLTQDLQGITRDKHLRVIAGSPPGRRPDAPSGPFGASRRLSGGVAYIDITSFGFSADETRDEVRKVMSAAADANALILDVRSNGGGSPAMVALVSSYLFGDEPVHLNSLYWRVEGRTDDFYTDPKVGGRKFGATKPVYVLTSSRTFSAAEEFTYNLQTRKRATIVGEATGGGAHPGGASRLPHGLRVFVPSGRAINPITKTNWEGTGVVPDVAVAAESALVTAHRLARARCRGASCPERR